MSVSLLATLATFCQTNHLAQHTLVVGLSGGVDSVVLLHALCQLRQTHALHFSALHINHQLSPHADAWADFCATLCQKWQVPFQTILVNCARQGGESLEAVARTRRYQALLSHPADTILLAHHADDQAETVLLQLLRGGGLAGMAAMPTQKMQAQKQIMRPLLRVSKQTILAYANQEKLTWVEDESNQNIQYRRNAWRHAILPALAQYYPHYQQTLAQTAQWCAESIQLQTDLARLDNQGQLTQLHASQLRQLPAYRAKNLLRVFLGQTLPHLPPPQQCEMILKQVCDAKADANILLKIGQHHLHRYQDQLYIVPIQTIPDAQCFDWQGEAYLDFANWGRLLFTPSPLGILRQSLFQQTLHIKPRQGSERIQWHGQTQSVKKCLQAARIPPWQRERLPFIFNAKHRLLAVLPVLHIQDANPTQADCIQLSWQAFSGEHS